MFASHEMWKLALRGIKKFEMDAERAKGEKEWNADVLHQTTTVAQKEGKNQFCVGGGPAAKKEEKNGKERNFGSSLNECRNGAMDNKN